MKMAPPSALDAHLGFWLRAVSNAVSGAFADQLAARGVSVAEWVALRTLWDHDRMPPSRLAEAIGMTRGGVTKLADKLIVKGLLEREARADDGRGQALVLTAEGRALTPELAALADANDARFFDALAPADGEMLTRVLRQVAEQSRLSSIPLH